MNVFTLFSFIFLLLQSTSRSSTSSGAGALAGGLIMVFVFVSVIIFAVVIFVVGRKMRQKRIQALQAFGAQHGWTFVQNPRMQIFQNPNAYSIFNHSSRDIIALLQRPHDDGVAFILDYSYTVGHGKNRHTYTQTIAAFYTPRLNIPFFALYPESFFSFIGEMFGYNDIDFHTHPVFSKTFKLSGRDEMPIRSIFHPQALSFFETQPKISVDGGGNYLFIYFHSQTFKPENLNAFLGTALNIYNLFRR